MAFGPTHAAVKVGAEDKDNNFDEESQALGNAGMDWWYTGGFRGVEGRGWS